MTDAALTVYDHVAYPSVPHADMHPAIIAAAASLCGHTSAPRENYSVLEIGCGSGANLLAMALAAPDSRFTGIDYAPGPIAAARASAKAAGLDNARFEVCNILSANTPRGPFDYVIAHGVYAWVPDAVRARLMPLCGEILSAEGLFAVSYNVLPGCRVRQLLRDMMLCVTRDIAAPQQKLAAARVFLEHQIEQWPDSDPLCVALKTEAKSSLKRAPNVLFHDELNEFYAPQLLSDVVADARSSGLAYVCDTHVSLFGEALRAAPQGEDGGQPDWLTVEQQTDFINLRRFRRSIFARAGGRSDRKLAPARLAGLYADADLTQDAPDPAAPGALTFRVRGGDTLTTDDAKVTELLQAIAAAYPGALDLSPYAAAGSLPRALLEVILSGALTLRTRPLQCTFAPGERPLASPLARAQAATGETTVASVIGGAVRLGDDAMQAFILLLDGTRTREDIARAMAARMGVTFAEAMDRTPGVLNHLARLGVIMA